MWRSYEIRASERARDTSRKQIIADVRVIVRTVRSASVAKQLTVASLAVEYIVARQWRIIITIG